MHDQKVTRSKKRHQRFSLRDVYGGFRVKAFRTNKGINVIQSPNLWYLSFAILANKTDIISEVLLRTNGQH